MAVAVVTPAARATTVADLDVSHHTRLLVRSTNKHVGSERRKHGRLIPSPLEPAQGVH